MCVAVAAAVVPTLPTAEAEHPATAEAGCCASGTREEAEKGFEGEDRTEEAAEKATVTFEVSYSDYEKIRRFTEKNGGEWQKENFGGTVVCSVVVPLAKTGEFRSGISELTAARVRFLENN